MLTKSTIAAAAPVAQLYADRSQYLEPAVGSPLASITRASMSQVFSAEGEGGLTDFATLLQASSAHADAGGAYEHDDTMAQLADRVRGAIQYNVQLAQGTVTGQIAQIVDRIDALQGEVEDTTVNRLRIVPSAILPAVESGLFEEVAQRYSETRAQSLPLKAKIAQPENIGDYLNTGNVTYDAAVLETVNILGEEYVRSIWERLFVSGASRLEELFPINDPKSWADLALAFTMVKSLQANIPAGINMPIAELEDYLMNLSVQLGRLISVAAKSRQTAVSHEKLVLGRPKTQTAGDIIVNSDIYGKYLEAGGTPEAILGAVNSRESIDNIAGLVEHRDRLERQWNVQRRIYQETVAANRFNATVNELRAQLGHLITGLTNEQLAEVVGHDNVAVGREALFARLAAYIKTVNISMLDNVWSEVRRIVCGVLYSHTAVETILKGIDREAARGAGEANINEAAFLSAVDYYVDWVCDQICKIQVG